LKDLIRTYQIRPRVRLLITLFRVDAPFTVTLRTIPKSLLRLYWIWYPVALEFRAQVTVICPAPVFFTDVIEGLFSRKAVADLLSVLTPVEALA
jgi:hypothetical protein